MFRLFLIFTCSLSLISCQKESQVDQATRDGILLVGNSADPKSLDLQVVSGVLESNILRSLYEGLVQFHPTDDLAAPPGAAFEITADKTATKWTVRLRPEARWSDGKPVTAGDFAFAYERILSPNFGGKYAEMLYFLKGAEEFNKGKIKNFSEVGFQFIDAHCFILTLRGPTPFFRELLKHYTWYPVPKHQVLKFGSMTGKGNRWSRAENLVSNGPFRIKSYRRNSHIEVERNPYYWNASQVRLNGIRFFPITNAFTEARMFRDGQLHITNSAAPEVVDLMKKVDPASLRQEPYLGTVLYRFNNDRAPLKDVRVRQALSLAIDRNALCESVFRGFKPAFAMVPPMGSYISPQGASFQVDQANKLLKEAGYACGNGFPRLKLLIASRETNVALATAVQAMWRVNLGIEIEIESKEWTAYTVAMQEMDYDIAGGGWIGDYIDPLTFLEMWSSENGNNNTGWSNAAFDSKLQESHLATSAETRFKLLQEAETILLAESPVTPIAWWGKNYLIHPSVKGWKPLLLDSHPYDSICLEKN